MTESHSSSTRFFCFLLKAPYHRFPFLSTLWTLSSQWIAHPTRAPARTRGAVVPLGRGNSLFALKPGRYRQPGASAKPAGQIHRQRVGVSQIRHSEVADDRIANASTEGGPACPCGKI